jgi:hypothetical protein
MRKLCIHRVPEVEEVGAEEVAEMVEVVEVDVKANIMRKRGSQDNITREAEDEVTDEVVGQITRISSVINMAGMATMRRTVIQTNVIIVAKSGISQEIATPRRK